MGRDCSSVPSRVLEREPDADRRRSPAPVARDARRQPGVSVQRREHGLDVDEGRLQLDHEQRSRGRMPGEPVDHATFPIDRVRHLGDGDPVVQRPEQPGHDLVERGMSRIDQLVRVHAAPAQLHLERGIESAGMSVEVLDRRTACLAGLVAADRGCRHAAPSRDIHKPLPSLDADRAESSAEADQVHAPIVADAAYRGLTRGRPGRGLRLGHQHQPAPTRPSSAGLSTAFSRGDR